MAIATMELVGFTELLNELKTVDEKKVKPLLRTAFRAGAKVICNTAKHTVPMTFSTAR